MDALFLPLHGAMVTEHEEDGEGALLEALRAKTGRALPIAVTLDLHANVTDPGSAPPSSGSPSRSAATWPATTRARSSPPRPAR